MKKSMKLLSLFLTILTLNFSILPSISAVYAAELNISSTNDSSDNIITEEEINNIIDDASSRHPDVSREWIEEVTRRQVKGDYTIPTPTIMTCSPWQGITVGQMGALIDTAISVALGGATGGLAALIKVKGRHAVQSAIRSAISKYLGSWFVNSVAIDFAMNLLSPGTYIAQQWDARDRVPNNGRINF